ncbi:hypothetical protein L2249_04115 [Xanthomonas perforans]|uniref:hypothetical protein n=1 Tax=Xanthomonas perforans TaxID=442694 RepID=UPI000319D3DB|nr:hypothetical protein [Xanthomonas perforans]MBZ2428073.1 hypothetical protein [Xanthomonas perforans]MBZ2445937.1 hypothetical protein [Xanthomonas perforans]MBZ2457307.1 hypothetical protein [Xanthomonas perforans]MBZ2466596.1 hypothetical protein [Xanthomonas perforans]MBZ2470900.1 hypothetical protein [Xanthomonas perforans]
MALHTRVACIATAHLRRIVAATVVLPGFFATSRTLRHCALVWEDRLAAKKAPSA